jgi:nucleoside-diphosphate-sugar epimerase
MRILLLGGSGFIGSALAGHLRSGDHEVVTLSSSSNADVQLDLCEPEAIESYLASAPFDTVVNMAGAGLTSGTADLRTMELINSELPPRLFRALAARESSAGVHLIHAASSTERLPGHESDESEYSRTKLAGTSMLEAELMDSTHNSQSSNVHVSICRVHNTYGPGQPGGRFIAYVINQLKSNRPVVLLHPDRIRDFVFLDETVGGIELLVGAGLSAPTRAELGTGVGLRLRECATHIADTLGRPSDLVIDGDSSTNDPNPVTVASERFGSLGNCRTDFAQGLEFTLKGA